MSFAHLGNHTTLLAVCILLCSGLLGACAPQGTALPTRAATPTATPAPLPAPAAALPVLDAVNGWDLQEEVRTYDRATLFDFMNGAADLYFTYGFQELAVAGFGNASGDALQVEIYRVATDADAYGLFTYNSYGEPVHLGVDGEIDGGYRLAFWRTRTFVQIVARQEIDPEALHAFGAAGASALPEGGRRPALVANLPKEDLLAGSTRFFREKMALDNLLWLGPDDVLGLGPDVEGIVAHYQVDDQGIDLLLIAFPTAGRAEAASEGLRGAGIENLAGVAVRGSVVGAAFGTAQGRPLLERAMAALP